MTHRKEPKTPRVMWIALYIGDTSNRERRINNGEAWSSRKAVEEWIKDEYGDYGHEYRVAKYLLDERVSPRDSTRKEGK